MKKENQKTGKSDFFESAKKHLATERLQKARVKTRNEIFSIRLSKLREMQGIKQTKVSGFTQPNVSRLEARDDMKLSTLIEYIESIGLDLEISVKSKSVPGPAIKLLKTG